MPDITLKHKTKVTIALRGGRDFLADGSAAAIFEDGALSQHHGLRKQKGGRNAADLAQSFRTPDFNTTMRRMGRVVPELTFFCCMVSKSSCHASSLSVRSTILSLVA